jgi:hypothetical protein
MPTARGRIASGCAGNAVGHRFIITRYNAGGGGGGGGAFFTTFRAPRRGVAAGPRGGCVTDEVGFPLRRITTTPLSVRGRVSIGADGGGCPREGVVSTARGLLGFLLAAGRRMILEESRRVGLIVGFL